MLFGCRNVVSLLDKSLHSCRRQMTVITEAGRLLHESRTSQELRDAQSSRLLISFISPFKGKYIPWPAGQMMILDMVLVCTTMG